MSSTAIDAAPGGVGPAPDMVQDQAATRRMCAGVYLDPDFRDLVLRRVYCDRNRRVAPSYGFSLIPVIVHAWRAWRLELAQHLMVVAIFITAAIWAWPDAAIAASILAMMYVGRKLLPLTGDLAAYYLRGKSYLEFEEARSRRDALWSGMLALGMICVLLIIASLGPPDRRSPWPWWALRSGLAGAAVTLTLVAAVVVLTGAVRQVRLGRLHDDEGRGRHVTGRRLRTIWTQQAHPFAVYSGSVPFIGSGRTMITWSFAQRLIPENPSVVAPDLDYDTPPFRAQALVEHLKEMIEDLRNDRDPETRLPGLTVTDQVFVEGTYARPYLAALRSGPDDQLVRNEIAKLIARSSDAARHYLACQVASWGGEVVTTVFVHISLQGRTLYLEFSTSALLPTRQEFHVIDEIGETGPKAVMRAAVKSLAGLPDVPAGLSPLMRAPGELWAALKARKDGTINASRRLDIGSTISIREEAIRGSDENYFQLRDIIQHWKIIERRLIASVDAFLRNNGVDASEFQQRSNTILNNSVFISSGGEINITGSAIGSQSSVGGDSAPPSGADA